MKISASRSDIFTRLQSVTRAASGRGAVPALGGILVEARAEGVRLASTDLELGIEVKLPGEASGEGSVVLPARLLLDVVRTLSGDEVTLELRPSEGDVELTSGSSRFHLRTLNADDFPQLPQPDVEPITIAAPALVATIELVARAASRDDARPILTGVLVSAEEQTLTMVATDSYRLSVKRTDLGSALPKPLEANVPARALRELSRLAADEEIEQVEISMLNNQIVFRVGDALLSSRLIDGQFPNYQQLLPESFEHEVRLPRDEFLEVTTRVSQLAQRNAPLRLAFSEGELTVAAETPEVGDASESMPASFKGEPLEIGFNPEFLKDGIETIEGEELLLKLISPLRPGLLEPVEGEDFSYLVMPIRLNV
jgi:DNA polymerase III subunit beta